MITDVRDRAALADEVLADVRDPDEVREPDADARARAAKLSMPDLPASGTSIMTRHHPWRLA
ncbi:MAG TPA: hypothetical protein VHH53_04780 [Pseudonocardiaceae bacterium]|nr:hypothetical protein [Pseudonocardiaceae bacterium]